MQRTLFGLCRRAAAEPATRRPRRIVLRPVGASLDLRQVRDELNRRFFGGRLEVDITWGRALPGAGYRRRGKRRSIRLGSYYADDRVIRVHRALDHPGVPRCVVESVVYHEMLHADIPAVIVNGRRHVHTREFRRRERLFPYREQARRWIGENLERLLRA